MGKSTRLLVSVVLSLSIFNAGCVTILRGTTENITVNTDPSGAQVSLNGKPVGTTPCVVNIRRKSLPTLVIDKEGYESVGYMVEADMGQARMMLWSLVSVLGGLIFFSFAVDLPTGSIISHKPPPTLQLKPVKAGARSN